MKRGNENEEDQTEEEQGFVQKQLVFALNSF